MVGGIHNNNSISVETFKALVDGNNTGVRENASYWKTDLINSGLFEEVGGSLIYTGRFPELVNEIKHFEPDPLFTNENWEAIRSNPLIDISPFKSAVKLRFEVITQQQNAEEQIVNEMYTAPLVDVISEQEDAEIPDVDILSTDLRYANSTRRVRNATWSLRIKRRYNYICAVPNCDVTGQIFVEAAHIIPDNVADEGTPHRAHILNGLCLCRHCHVAFDKGYFSLTDDHRIITSTYFSEIVDQNLKGVIVSSANSTIKNRNDNRMPLVEFIQYHRANKFRN